MTSRWLPTRLSCVHVRSRPLRSPSERWGTWLLCGLSQSWRKSKESTCSPLCPLTFFYHLPSESVEASGWAAGYPRTSDDGSGWSWWSSYPSLVFHRHVILQYHWCNHGDCWTSLHQTAAGFGGGGMPLSSWIQRTVLPGEMGWVWSECFLNVLYILVLFVSHWQCLAAIYTVIFYYIYIPIIYAIVGDFP